MKRILGMVLGGTLGIIALALSFFRVPPDVERVLPLLETNVDIGSEVSSQILHGETRSFVFHLRNPRREPVTVEAVDFIQPWVGVAPESKVHLPLSLPSHRTTKLIVHVTPVPPQVGLLIVNCNLTVRDSDGIYTILRSNLQVDCIGCVNSDTSVVALGTIAKQRPSEPIQIKLWHPDKLKVPVFLTASSDDPAIRVEFESDPQSSAEQSRIYFGTLRVAVNNNAVSERMRAKITAQFDCGSLELVCVGWGVSP